MHHHPRLPGRLTEDAFRRAQIAAGAEFEEALQAYLGVKHAIAVSDATNAMLLGLRAIGLAPGDEVILARNGRPVARLVPWTTSAPTRSPGAWSGRFEVPDDVVGSDPDVIEMFDRSADSTR